MYFLLKRNSIKEEENEEEGEMITLTHIDQCKNSNLHELFIKVYPTPTLKLKKIQRINRNKKNNFSNKMTENCISYLVSKFNNDEEVIRSGKKNFFCPFHENPNTSKSKSARFIINLGIFRCYSSVCPYPNLWSCHLLEKLSAL